MFVSCVSDNLPPSVCAHELLGHSRLLLYVAQLANILKHTIFPKIHNTFLEFFMKKKSTSRQWIFRAEGRSTWPLGGKIYKTVYFQYNGSPGKLLSATYERHAHETTR